MHCTLEELAGASEAEATLVVSTTGLAAAEYLERTFGIPFETGYPCLPEALTETAGQLRGKHVLIVHQQLAANALREKLTGCETDCASWFMLHREYAGENDFSVRTEDDLREAAGGYDVIIADAMLRRAVPEFSGTWLDFPHFAVSGRCAPRAEGRHGR